MLQWLHGKQQQQHQVVFRALKYFFFQLNSGPPELPAEEIDSEEQQQLHDPRVRTHPLHARHLAIPGPHTNITQTLMLKDGGRDYMPVPNFIDSIN